jgi:hypothetical protein
MITGSANGFCRHSTPKAKRRETGYTAAFLLLQVTRSVLQTYSEWGCRNTLARQFGYANKDRRLV